MGQLALGQRALGPIGGAVYYAEALIEKLLRLEA